MTLKKISMIMKLESMTPSSDKLKLKMLKTFLETKKRFEKLAVWNLKSPYFLLTGSRIEQQLFQSKQNSSRTPNPSRPSDKRTPARKSENSPALQRWEQSNEPDQVP
jgi:hypothetical protein